MMFLEAGIYKAANNLAINVIARLTKPRSMEEVEAVAYMEDLASSYAIHRRHAKVQKMRTAVLYASRRIRGDEDLVVLSRMQDLAVSNALLGLLEEAEQLG
jgi:hypothetical protein